MPGATVRMNGSPTSFSSTVWIGPSFGAETGECAGVGPAAWARSSPAATTAATSARTNAMATFGRSGANRIGHILRPHRR